VARLAANVQSIGSPLALHARDVGPTYEKARREIRKRAIPVKRTHAGASIADLATGSARGSASIPLGFVVRGATPGRSPGLEAKENRRLTSVNRRFQIVR